ncbi:energy transducer TonB [Photobacterium damselae]|uniref:energy transducer TonB n=1 Tax=Photobacterium damselae TaxID=38293 RepID=UPI000D073539|nr:energy transducer TonB [Photobacterium damselae]NVO74271.1 energy transducer TonB [Photobacterium damselae subsp. damselae]PSB85156.1 energy transducer TonB [Photobacterium damselae subsp. damselae]SPY24353.1 transport protein TonB [Photobacterium damselae]
MDTTRYVIAGAVSVIIHGLILSAVPSQNAIAMPIGNQIAPVSLNLVTAPIAPPPPAQDVAKAEVKPQKSVKKTQQIEQKTAVKKLVKKTTPTKKAAKKVANKTTKTKKAEQKPVVKNRDSKPVKSATKPQPQSKPKNETSQVANTANNKKAQLSSGTQSPELVSRPTFATRPGPVSYPRLAKRRGIQGQVMVEIWIDPKGKQIKQKVISSSGTEILDQAALTAIKKWKFSSHIVDGQAIAHRVHIPVRFQLD